MARFSRVAFVSLSMLLPSVAFRVKPKRKNDLSSKIDLSSYVPAGNKVVTLGDSYSSGTGIHRRGSSYTGGECWREGQTTPGGRLASASTQNHVQVACKGAQIPDIHRQFDSLHESYPQDFAAGWANSTILFTIGGNDLRTNGGQTWPNLLTSCILSFYGACHEQHENQIANWDQLQSSLTQLYTKVVQDAPHARIRILGYPRLMQRKLFCIPVPGLAFGAADWADQQVDELNRRLRAAVNTVRAQTSALIEDKSETVMDKLQKKATAGGTAFVSTFEATLKRKGTPAPAPTPAPPPPPASIVDIQFVDPYMYYGRGACRVSSREVNAIVLDGFSLSDSSFHPSQRGYDRYFAALEDSVGGSYPMNAVYATEPVDPAELMHVFDGWDANKDGKLDIDEAIAMDAEEENALHQEQVRSIFAEADADGDSFLIASEFEVFGALSDALDEAEGNPAPTPAPAEPVDVIVGAESWSCGSCNAPAGYLPEDTNKNYGFWSKYVYVKARVERSLLGCSGFEFHQSGSSTRHERGTGDLAEGAGGNHRYIVPVGSVPAEAAVKRVWWQEGRGNNNGNCTGDINEGRMGRYLYFCWSN